MARIAVADGIVTMACTPHIYPGVYDNTGDGIRQDIVKLQMALDTFNIPLKLVLIHLISYRIHMIRNLGLEEGFRPLYQKMLVSTCKLLHLLQMLQ